MTRNSGNFKDPYDFVVGDDQLTIEFYGYQGTVSYADMDNCIRGANHDFIQHLLAGQTDAPMGPGPFVWSSGNAALHLMPDEQLTWGRWALVPLSMAIFVTQNEFKGTQFILLWHDIGPIGYGQFMAIGEAQPSISTARANAFPDPYDKIVESMGLTIEFYGYRGTVAPMAMRECIAAASNDVVRHLLERETPMEMDAPSYSYLAGGVNLFLKPGENLTWHLWAFIPIWIQEFVTENEFKGTQFILLINGLGAVGYGELI